MSTKLTSYKIFIASPSGLEMERRLFRDVVNEHNETDANARGVHFIPVGWEITLAGIGRPQSIINEELKQCDYFILLLWDRWGTPTGTPEGYSSGTHEEFVVAMQCRKDNSTPMRQVVCLFKSIDPRQLADPGEQLKKVLEFKKERQDKKDLLYNEFDEIENFKKRLRSHLAQWIRGHESGGDLKDLEQSELSSESTLSKDLQALEVVKSGDQSEQLAEAQELADQGKLIEAEEIFVRAAIRGTDLEAINHYGIFLMKIGRLKQAQVMYERVAELANILGDDDSAAVAYCNLGNLFGTYGELNKAEDMFRKSLDIHQKTGRQDGVADAFGNLGIIYKTRGEISEAENAFKRSLEIHELLESKEGMAAAYGNLGTIYKIRNDLKKSEEMIEKSLELFKKIEDQEGIANAYCNLGNVYVLRDNLEQAEMFFKKALGIFERLGYMGGIGIVYCNLGIVYGKRNDVAGAEEMFRMALEINEKLGRQEGVANAYGNMGNIYFLNGNLEKAMEMYRKALDIDERLGRLTGMANTYSNIADIFEKKGDRVQAKEFFKRALELSLRLGNDIWAGELRVDVERLS
jgi:tetratricopeptide (TPR) repeat protein